MTVRLLLGDARQRLRDLPDGSVHTCVTSPPYFRQRDYEADGQVGREDTPDEFVAALVEVFREVRRVLRDDGTLWLNMGDKFARTGGTGRKASATARVGNTKASVHMAGDRTSKRLPGLRDKELIGVPWMLAFALRADGWFLRQDIIWHKPNAQPEPVKDRCVSSHEHVFLLTKGPRYYFDADAIAEEATCERKRGSGPMFKSGTGRQDAASGTVGDYRDGKEDDGKRNKRDVWSVNTVSFPEAHFATYPPELIEPCILAGCPKGGTVLDPFGGAATTGMVADRIDRHAILIELNPEYAQIAEQRLRRDGGMFLDLKVER